MRGRPTSKLGWKNCSRQTAMIPTGLPLLETLNVHTFRRQRQLVKFWALYIDKPHTRSGHRHHPSVHSLSEAFWPVPRFFFPFHPAGKLWRPATLYQRADAVLLELRVLSHGHHVHRRVRGHHVQDCPRQGLPGSVSPRRIGESLSHFSFFPVSAVFLGI